MKTWFYIKYYHHNLVYLHYFSLSSDQRPHSTGPSNISLCWLHIVAPTTLYTQYWNTFCLLKNLFLRLSQNTRHAPDRQWRCSTKTEWPKQRNQLCRSAVSQKYFQIVAPLQVFSNFQYVQPACQLVLPSSTPRQSEVHKCNRGFSTVQCT